MGTRVCVLGTITIEHDGRPVDAGSGRQLRLLAALVVAGPRGAPLDQLADRVWDDGDRPAGAAASLRTYVARLRQVLGDDAERLATTPTGYALVVDGELDAIRFERAIDAARAATDDARHRLRVLDGALAEWRGGAFEPLSDLPWLAPEAHRLDELRLVAEEERLDALLALGDAALVVADVERLIARHPLRERLHALRMLSLHRCGRQAEALRAFQDHRRQLATDLGLEPGPALAELERRIAAADPTLSTTKAPAAAVRGYELLERLGEGAFSVVYRGRQASVGREVAIKQIRAELANRPEFIRRFETEAQLVARLEHPHVVPLIDYWREPGSAYLVMRLLRGGSLESVLREGPLPLDRAVTLAEEVGGALATAHRQGVVHRDVKPANILLDDEGRAYLTDFGIALAASEAGDPSAALSAGSPAYAAPEQLRRLAVGPPADVHGLGIVLFEALTGRLPFPDEHTRAGLLQRQLHEPVPSVRDVRTDVPPAVDAVIARATAKDPLARYASVAELIDDLRAAAGNGHQPSQGRAAVAYRGHATAVGDLERNPYKGLRAFDEADSADFHGRERLVDELLDAVQRHRVVAVVGPSGSGKSSVVRAGLLPALRAGRVPGSSSWFVSALLPGGHPFDELEAALLRVARDHPAGLAEQLHDGERGLARALRRVIPDGSELLVVIDQFEELFTLTDPTVARRFVDAVVMAATEERSRLRVVLTLRADFYDRPLRHEALGRLVRDATVAVVPLAADEIERAIVEPLAAVGGEVEPGLVAEIVADVSDQPGALPLLQFALTELFERRISGLLTRHSYRDLGGIAGAIAGRAEQLVAAESDDDRAAVRRIFGRLVTLGEGTEDTRRRARRAELGDDEATQRMIDGFGAARLLSFDRDPVTREPTVDVAHEALLRSWPRLRAWLDDDRDDLRVLRHLSDAANAWDGRGRDDAELYRGARLDGALDWTARHGGEATGVEVAFVDASRRRREQERLRERRHVRRLRSALAAIAAVALVAVAAGGVAVRQQRRASRNADVAAASEAQARDNAATAEANATEARDNAMRADQARLEADTGRLAAEAAARVATDRQLALLLAAESFRLGQTAVSYGALQRVLSGTGPFLGAMASDRSFSAVNWLDDGTIVAVGPSGVGRYDPASGVERSWSPADVAARQIQWGDGLLTRFVVADTSVTSGVTAAVVASDPTRVVRTDRDGSMRDLLRHPADVAAVAMSPSGRVAATLDVVGTLRIIEIASGRVEREIAAHPEKTLFDQLLPGVRWLSDRASQELAKRTPPLVYPPRLQFRGDSELLSVQTQSVRRWDLTTGTRLGDGGGLVVLGGVLSSLPLAGARPSPDGSTFVWRDSFRVGVGDFGAVPARASFFVPGSGLIMATPKVVDVAWLANGLWILLNDGRLLHTTTAGDLLLDVGTGVVSPVALAQRPDGARVAVVGASGIAVIATDGTGLIARAGPRAGADSLFLDGPGRRVFASSGTVYAQAAHPVLDITPTALVPRSAGNVDQFWNVFDGGAITTSNPFTGARIGIVDPTTLEQRVLLENSGSWQAHATSLDGRWLATGELGKVNMYDTSTGKRVASYESGDPTNTAISFHPDGTRFFAAFSGKPAVILSVPDLAIVATPVFAEGRVAGVRWTEDGRWLLTVDDARRVTVRDPVTFAPVSVLDGSRTPPGYEWLLQSIGKGERILATVNGAPALWDARTGTPIGAPFPLAEGTRADGVDGLDLLVGALGEHVLLWDLDIERWFDIACRAAGRNLTREEWSRFGPAGQPYRATCEQWPVDAPV